MTKFYLYQAPGDPPKWNDSLYANTDAPSCPQYISVLPTPVVGQEDCLTLNVFTPIVTQEEPLPVMVFFHGGGFYWEAIISTFTIQYF